MSLIERLITRPRPLWQTICISLLLLLAPLGAISADGMWDSVLLWGNLRLYFVAPVVIVYILFVSQWMSKSDSNLTKAFRPLLLIDDDGFDALVHKAASLKPKHQLLALMGGLLIGVWISLPWVRATQTFWLRLYVPVSLCLMWGLLAWIIYSSMAGTKLIRVLHQQPFRVDILDIKPFEPMGRYSLVNSLVFVGGIILGLLFGLDMENILSWQNWLVYLPLMCVPVVIFFLNMQPTHRLLANEKKRELASVTHEIQRVGAVLRAHIARGESMGESAGEYSALLAVEARLRVASTWPYNTGMLRTLFVSILGPLLVQEILILLFNQ